MIAVAALASCDKDPVTTSESDHVVYSYIDGLYVEASDYKGTGTAYTVLSKGREVKFPKSIYQKISVTCPEGRGCEYLFNGTKHFVSMKF